MFPFLRFKLDWLSFWSGVAASTIFWWLFLTLRRLLPALRQEIQKRAQSARESLTASTESRLRQDMVRLAQHMHLAAQYCPLDEIVIEPRLMQPPPPPRPGTGESGLENGSDSESDSESATGTSSEAGAVNIYSQILPYLPDWNELASAFHAPTLSLQDSLEGGANLILIGHPGSGKTVALAYLAMEIARQPDSHFVPVLVHAADLPPLFLESRTPLDTLVEGLTGHVSTLTLARLPKFMQEILQSGRALLLLDGLDEIPPAAVQPIARFLSQLLQDYPEARMVVAASADYYDGLTKLGLLPVAIAGWGTAQRAQFTEKWGQAWERWYPPGENTTPESVAPILLNSWLQSQDVPITPLEYTLKVWAAYAGDILGADPSAALEAYVRRLVDQQPKARLALETLARQMVSALNPVCTLKEAENWIAEFEQVSPAAEASSEEKSKIDPGSSTVRSAARGYPGRLIPMLVQQGLLTNRPEARLNFTHPVLLGYLAGHAFARLGNLGNLELQPEWSGKTGTLYTLVQLVDLSNIVNGYLAQSAEDPLNRGILRVARWLRVAPKNALWRALALRQLVTSLQREFLAFGPSVRLLVALATTGESGLAPLFRQMLRATDGNQQFLALLGCGLMRDSKAIVDLVGFVNDDNNPVLGQVACLALSAIGDKTAHEEIIQALMNGNDDVRSTAAEVLAMDATEGHATLKEAIGLDDLLVRRAAVYGLSRVRQPWAMQLIEHISVEDRQWVVRSAATQAIDESKQPDPYIPIKRPALHETPWLIA